MKKILLASVVLSLSGCATTSAVTNIVKQEVKKSAKKAAVDAVKQKVVETVQGGNAQSQKTAGPVVMARIDSAPMMVTMKKTNGKTSALSKQPKIAIAGYNIGAFIGSTVKGKASGDLLGYSQGSSSRITWTTVGIDAAMLERVANAAHDDLAAQLTAIGVDVVTAAQVAAAPSAAKLKFTNSTYTDTIKLARGKKEILVAGPSATGARSYIAPGKTTYGYNAGSKPSAELQAVMLMPNLVLDFASMKGNNARMTSKSTASAKLRFAIDPSSEMMMTVSKGRYMDGMLKYQLKGDAVSDANFATVAMGKTTSNRLEQGIGLALGMATRSKKQKAGVVTIDPARYEALALKAAKGWNKAYVAQIKAAKGL